MLSAQALAKKRSEHFIRMPCICFVHVVLDVSLLTATESVDVLVLSGSQLSQVYRLPPLPPTSLRLDDSMI